MLKSEFQRTADFYRASTQAEKLYYGAGIPSNAWKSLEARVKFQLIVYNDKQFSTKKQQKWYDFIQETERFSKPYLTIIGGIDDDYLARQIAFHFMKKALSVNHLVQITNTIEIPTEIVRDETVFMLHNVFAECTDKRIQEIRDWTTKHEDCYRIIAMGGNPSVLTQRCRIVPNGLLYVREDVEKINRV